MPRPFFLTFIGPCIANIFIEYNQQEAKFLNLFISVRRSTCFSFSIHHQELKTARTASGICQTRLYVQFWAPDDSRKNRLKHVVRLTEVNKLRNVASRWLYSANMCQGSLSLFKMLLSGLARARILWFFQLRAWQRNKAMSLCVPTSNDK